MASRRGPVFSVIAITIAVPACAAGDDETSPPERVPTTAPARAMATASTLPASPPPDVTSTDPGPSTAAPSPAPLSVIWAHRWSAVYGFGGVWIQVDPPVDQFVKVDEVSGAVTLTIDAGPGAAIAGDAVWVTVGGAETRKIDPVTGEVLLVVATPGASTSPWAQVPSGSRARRVSRVSIR